MRSSALLGGAAMIAAVLVWYRPLAADAGLECKQVSASTVCAAVVGLTEAVGELPPISAAGRLPLPEVRGAVDPSVTQANIDETICRPGYSRLKRPSYAITGPLKRRMMTDQHPGEPLSAYELDHLIPISLGGTPLGSRNLWLQPRAGLANAADKNVLAYVLWCLVCERRVKLYDAQSAIRRNWIAAYQVYATAENVARYRFRPNERLYRPYRPQRSSADS